MTEKEALALPLESQYALAAERYTVFNERFAEAQLEISADEWMNRNSTYEEVPNGGGSRSRLRGATNDNSYYFVAFRHIPLEENPEYVLQGLAKAWALRYSGFESGTTDSDQIWLEAAMDDGFWIEASEDGEGLTLTAYSPMYWGDSLALTMAIGERRVTEDALGGVWPKDVREDGTSLHLPGDYRPFPRWETEPTEWNHGFSE